MLITKKYVCHWCGKKFTKFFKYPSHLKNFDKKDKFYCNQSCATRYRNSIYPSGMLGKKVSNETKKKISNKNKNHPTIGFRTTSKEMNARQKELKTGFYDKNLQSKLSKRANKSNGGKIGGKKSIQILHENYLKSREINGELYQKMKKASSDNLKKATEILKQNIKQNKKFYFDNIGFYSKSEMCFAKFLVDNKIISHIEYGKNYNIKIGTKTIDFLINNIYIEFHPFLSNGKDRQGRNYEEYFKQRKDVLYENNINKKLIVTQSIKEFKEKFLKEFA